ncbi:putative hydrolase [Meredithblackwellia eburnea MCA 4105]
MSLRFLAYQSKQVATQRIGLVSADSKTVTPLLFPSGQPIKTLQELIANWDLVSTNLLPGSPVEEVENVKILAPLTGRDVLAVGKNYVAHAREFQQSGFDSSDKKEQPDFPVIFTKRATSIVPTGTEIYPHPSVTETVDYEGELGIIIGKGGIGIKKADAWKHVWGATIINDVTARERQRDHKQFFIGKSLDTFCPMGPYAVHSSMLEWKNLVLETRVNGETRQKQNTSELIFDIPTLIETCSMGITLQPGDVIATGTPAGVGIGRSPPIYLKTGDKIDVEITGLGVLTNTIGCAASPPPACEPLLKPAELPLTLPDCNLKHLPTGLRLHFSSLTSASTFSPSKPTIIFIHGLGGSSSNWLPLIQVAKLEDSHNVIAFDLEGHGLSPLSGEDISIDGFAESVKGVLETVGAQKAVVVGHSMGGLVATTFASRYAEFVSKLVLVGGVKSFAPAGVQALTGRAATVRTGGLSAIASTVTNAGISTLSSTSRPLSKVSVYASLITSPAEGYARACVALAGANDPDYSKIVVPTLFVAGTEDKTCPKATVEFLAKEIKGTKVVTLENVGHWHQVEDVEGVAKALVEFL